WADTKPSGSEAHFNGSGVFIDEERIDVLRERIELEEAPTAGAFEELMAREAELLAHEPEVPDVWYVPPYYQDAGGHRESKEALKRDANNAYRLALLYRLTEEEEYAEAAVRLIEPWTDLEELETHHDSSLSFSYHFPSMIFAADLLRASEAWTSSLEEEFSVWIRERALPMNTMDRQNNWGNWGLVLVMAIAAFTENDELFKEGVERWKHFIEVQIAEDGHLPHEVTRNDGIGERGIWYTHFTLMPQTIAAEIAYVNGVDLYDYESPSGRTLEQAFRRVAAWALNPDTFPYFQAGEGREQRATDYVGYFEILNTRWPDDAATEMLEQKRPIDPDHSAPVITLTHGTPE
ncbi:MAG: alginate lyase family protein, partial [Candidatus Hydrogenedentota bacterium]